MKLEDMRAGRKYGKEVEHAKYVKTRDKKIRGIKNQLRRLGFLERHAWRLEEGHGGVLLSHPELPKPLPLIEHGDGLLDWSLVDPSRSRGYYTGPGMKTQEDILWALERMQKYDWSYDREE